MPQIKGHSLQLRKTRLVEILIETGAFKYSEEPVFQLASGDRSQFYVDCKLAISFAEAREVIGGMIYEKIRSEKVNAVGGLIIGAYPIAIAVSDAAHREDNEDIAAFVVRKEAKPHGLKKMVEGSVRQGDRVLIVDDVITSGSSTIDAIEKSRSEGLEIVRAIAVIDREEKNGRQNIEAQEVPFEALCTLNEILSAFKSRGAKRTR